jgi:hypothetical protein
MNLELHAREELRRAGLLSPDSDYDGAIGESVIELVKVFAAQGHSGQSAHMTLEVFNRVAGYKLLSPLGNPTQTKEYVEHQPDMWQSTRDPAVFSSDQGKTWYHLDTHRTRWQRVLAWLRSKTGAPIPITWIRGRVA